jgi:hypothetical protein
VNEIIPLHTINLDPTIVEHHQEEVMPNQTHAQWMPAFIVFPATRELAASDTDEAVYTAEQPRSVPHDYWQRVGTAHARSDGGFDIHLTAIPVNGRLIIRPPKEHESIDPTVVTSR